MSASNATEASHGADWDLSAYFDGVGTERFTAAKRELEQRGAALARAVPTERAAFTEFVLELEAADACARHLGSYLGCASAADARDEALAQEEGWLASAGATLEKARVALRAALGALEEAAFEQLLAEPRLAPLAYPLRRLRQSAQRSMNAELEALAADLDVTGMSAWGRLYDRVSGKLEFTLEHPGRSERRSAAEARSLMHGPDAALRASVLRSVNRAWESVSDVTTATLNGIAGTRLTLYGRRGITDFLEPALFDAAIERSTLDAMLGAVAERRELPRRYLRLAARLMGKAQLGFQDLEAPPLPPRTAPDGSASTALPFAVGSALVSAAFERFHPRLGAFARKAINARWVDHTPRLGKRPGAFCSSSPLIEQSRVFMTFAGTDSDVQTLAHELGHAYHSSVMTGLQPWARFSPMTLAETASTFGELIVSDARLLAASSDAERLELLAGRLGDAAAFLLNIPMRFEFERNVYTERKNGELSTSRLCTLMEEAQQAHYGDTLAPAELDRWFWASKLHFHIAELSFYNFPYTFGFLLSRGLWSLSERLPRAQFMEQYDALLRSTGTGTAEQVVEPALGVKLGEPAFWHSALDSVEADLTAFERLLG